MEQAKNEELKEKILAAAQNGRLACSEAFAIAAQLNCPRAEVGKMCNELEIKIAECQLGCF